MTLDEFRFRFFSSRVISVLSYYLTSLVTSIFYSDEQIPYLISISLLFRFVSYLLFLAFPLLPHIRINAFAVSCRLLRIRTITFCICFQIDPSEYLLACVISYDRFGFLRSAFLICVCFLGFCCCVFCCVWLPGFARLSLWQLLFRLFGTLSFRLSIYKLW